jgi:thioredoxin 1
MSEHIIEVTDDNFQELVIKSEKPVLVDFWAPWCGPCKMIAPLLEELAANRDDIIIAKVNVDENTKTPAELGVRGIPALMIFNGGHLQGTKIGAMPKSQLESFIEQVVR